MTFSIINNIIDIFEHISTAHLLQLNIMNFSIL